MSSHYEVSDQARAAALRRVGHGLLSGATTISRPPRAQIFQRDCYIDGPPADVLEFCRTGRGFRTILPDRLTLLDGDDVVFELGGEYHFRWWMRGVLPMRWDVIIDRFEPGREFADLQLRGAFRYFHHTHTAVPESTGTRYTDRIVYATALGARLDRVVVARELDRVFRIRHRRMAELLGSRRDSGSAV